MLLLLLNNKLIAIGKQSLKTQTHMQKSRHTQLLTGECEHGGSNEKYDLKKILHWGSVVCLGLKEQKLQLNGQSLDS